MTKVIFENIYYSRGENIPPKNILIIKTKPISLKTNSLHTYSLGMFTTYLLHGSMNCKLKRDFYYVTEFDNGPISHGNKLTI